MQGTPVTPWRRLPAVGTGQRIRVRVGDWPSGLYFAKLRTGRGVAFAPFVVAPRRLGTNRVAVVLPTRTWQAYNLRDDDEDGVADTWYARDDSDEARLGRPFLNAGVPPNFRKYDLGFLQWLHDTGRGVDVLAQEDLDETNGIRLARAYDLLVFPGHHEYVTKAEYDAVTGFRNRGGNLMFLSANNFFWRIDVSRGVMTRVARWRSLGRPEARLLGVQYIGNGHGIRGSWRVRKAAPKWLFADVRLGRGGAFSSGGIEVDAKAASSPPGTRIVAAIPNVLGRGKSAHMTFYETRRGAKVFSAGAFTLAGSMRQPAVQRLLTNLWERLARTVDTPSGLRPATVSHGRPAARERPARARGHASAVPRPSPRERVRARRGVAATQRDGARGERVARSARRRARGLRHATTEARAR